MPDPVPGWPTGPDAHKSTEGEKAQGRMALWMLLIMVGVVVLGYLLVKQMLGL